MRAGIRTRVPAFLWGKMVRVLLLLLLTVVTLAVGTHVVLAAEAEKAAEKPYTIIEGQVDKKTCNGWPPYTEPCLRCHGPDGAGSSYAPSLVDSAKRMSQDEFNEIVINGRTNVSAASDNVMPPFGTVEDVVIY